LQRIAGRVGFRTILGILGAGGQAGLGAYKDQIAASAILQHVAAIAVAGARANANTRAVRRCVGTVSHWIDVSCEPQVVDAALDSVPGGFTVDPGVREGVATIDTGSEIGIERDGASALLKRLRAVLKAQRGPAKVLHADVGVIAVTIRPTFDAVRTRSARVGALVAILTHESLRAFIAVLTRKPFRALVAVFTREAFVPTFIAVCAGETVVWAATHCLRGEGNAQLVFATATAFTVAIIRARTPMRAPN
jgi:hypothetical protein